MVFLRLVPSIWFIVLVLVLLGIYFISSLYKIIFRWDPDRDFDLSGQSLYEGDKKMYQFLFGSNWSSAMRKVQIIVLSIFLILYLAILALMVFMAFSSN